MDAVVPNFLEPFQIRSEFFEGRALFLLRAPGEDLDRCPSAAVFEQQEAADGSVGSGGKSLTPPGHTFANIFRGKQRTLEVQVQGRFLRPPRGQVRQSVSH